MRLRSRLTAIAHRPHLPRRSVRLRLTLLYGGLFLAAGAAMLAVTYVLVVRATANVVFKGQKGSVFSSAGFTVIGQPPNGAHRAAKVMLGGKALSSTQVHDLFQRVQASAVAQHASELHQLLTQSGIALAAMTVLCVGLGWLVAGRVLRPLRTITTTAREISASNLQRRLAFGGPDDELKELADTFDQLLARLDASFRSQRQFVANASHELRTPLARQRTLIQVALSDPDATVDTLRAAHERVLASGGQQAELIDALLTLTRGQAGLERSETFDLAAVTDQVVLARRADAKQRGIELHAELAAAPATGDPRLVERLVANVVDNALRHNITSGRVDVATHTHDGHACLAVVNTGPTVPSTAVGRIFQPFQRLDAQRTGHGKGLGLGLSIVQA
ncbi:MAG: sensor histidine kinase, partial [Sciscionella sp.]